MICPLCKLGDDVIGVAMHLTEGHNWSYDEVMNWLRSVEEKKCA
jgi:hypothetical protein